jgi:hypothetical protein
VSITVVVLSVALGVYVHAINWGKEARLMRASRFGTILSARLGNA